MATRQAGRVEVGVTANLDEYNKRFDQAKRTAQDFGVQAARATIPVTTATQQVTQAVAGLTKQSATSQIAMGALNTSMNVFKTIATSSLGPLAGLVGLAGLGGIIYAVNSAIGAFGRFEQQQMDFAAILRATNQGLGVTADSIETISRSVGRDTLTPVDQLRQAFVQLGRDGLVVGDNLERSIRILPDLAMRVGGFSQAITLLTQALQWPSKSMEQLRQAGIHLSQAQIDGLKNANLFTDAIHAQGDVLSILEEHIGGEATARGQGVVGGLQRLSSATQDLFINLGGLAESYLHTADGARSLAGVLEDLNKRFFPTTAADRIAAMNTEITDLTTSIERLKSVSAGGIVTDQQSGSLMFGGPIDTSGTTLLALQRRLDAVTLARDVQALGQAYAHADAELAGLQAQQEAHARTISHDIEELTGRLYNMTQSTTRAELATRIWAQANHKAFNSPDAQEHLRLLTAIERENRRLAQAGRQGPLELENERIKQQTELLQYNTQERQVQQEIMRVSLQLQRRGQELEPQDRKDLEERIRLMRELQRATAVVEEAATSVFNNIASAIADFAVKGKFDFHQMAESIIRDLVRIALQAYVTRPLVQAITGFTNPMISSAYGVAAPTVGSIPKFQHGGSFMIPGSGGADKPSLLMGLGPGERVDITPAGQAKKGTGGSVTVINHLNTSKDMQVEQRERTGPGGQKIIEQVFTEVLKRFGRGDADQTMAARFGVRSRVIQR